MPQDPRTWNPNDYVSASYLDYDLYAAGSGYPVSLQFVPNGIRWHSQKAVYKAVILGSNQTLASGGTWKQIFTGGVQPQVIVDNAGLYGAHMDPAHTGIIQDVILSSGGGFPLTQGGGWYLMSGFVPTNSTGGTNNVSAGLAQNALTPNLWGTQQKAIQVTGVCTPFVLDLVDTSTNTYTLAASSNGTTAASIPVTTDGSGTIPSFSAHWVGTNIGFTTGTPAPVPSWTSASTITAALLNGATGIQGPLRNLNFPPMFRGYAGAGAGISVPTSTNTNAPLATVSVDNYAGYSSPTYTVPQAGLYLVHFIGLFNNFSGQCMAGVNINGTIYWGPAMPTPSAGNVSATKTQIFSLNSGDTITPVLWQNSGSTQTTSTTTPCRMIIVKVSGAGVPSTLPAVPDVTYRWTAGMQPDLSSAFNAHLANDLTFLTYKPYLMTYQTTATTGIGQSTSTRVSMNQNTGIVHGDNGDNYSGYSLSTYAYTVQRTGWYMGVGEIFMALPSLTTSPLSSFQVFVAPGGITSSDAYQSAFQTTSNNVGGCTGVCYYHLRAGDVIYPGVYTAYSSSTTTGTSVATGKNSHFELVWISE